MANAIKVHSVDQEYWYIRTQRCKCGGELEVGNQALLSSQDLQFDVLDTRCKHCGHETSYKFDITNFAPRAITQQSMEKIAMGIPAEKVWSFIEIPMEKAVKSLFSTLLKPKTNLLWITWKVLSSMQERNLKLP